MAKKTTPHHPPQIPPDDIERFKGICRKIIDQLEESVSAGRAESEQECNLRQRHHDRMFGNKSSLTSVLTSLTEVMLKLNAHDWKSGDVNAAAEMPGFTANDITLVEEFIRKAQIG